MFLVFNCWSIIFDSYQVAQRGGNWRFWS